MIFDYTDLLGKKFKVGGRGAAEFDCYGLAMEVYKRLGRTLPECGAAHDNARLHGCFLDVIPAFQKLEKPEPYCLVAFYIKPPYVSHVGVLLDDCRRFLHIMPSTMVSVATLFDPRWLRRVEGFYVTR